MVTLWAYKSLMLVVFQNKIIYMPSVPPFSRSEKIEDYAASCRPVMWREERIKAADGTKLALAVGEIPEEMSKRDEDEGKVLVRKKRRVVIVYFQGNGASIPPRLPALTSILRSLNAAHNSTTYTILALSYRGFWTSSGRASEAGIKLDAAAALSWATENFPSSMVGSEEDVRFVLWGQSLGAGVAADAAATLAIRSDTSKGSRGMNIDGLLLETPFVSVEAMLLALYPQKWLPYRYLGVFLRNHWDSRVALQRLANSQGEDTRLARSKNEHSVKILILQAEKDELVPASQALELGAFARGAKLDVQRIEVKGALHNEAAMKSSGRAAIVRFMRDIWDTAEEHGTA